MSNQPAQQPATPPVSNRPNENGVISVQGYFRIFDPKTQKTYTEGRA